MPLKVAVLDGHPVYRAGLRAILSGEEDFLLVELSDDLEMVDRTRADVWMVELSPQAHDGLGPARELLRRDPSRRLLVVTPRAEESAVADAVAAGATGVVARDQAVSEVLFALRAVADGRRYVPPGVSLEGIEARLRRGRAGPLGILSAREREVFDLLVQGLTNEQVSGQLGITRRTVETHRSRILKKLHVHSAVELIRLAARHGLLGT
jgi:DNA-binding NarL/FixJ family response regulator